MIFHKYSIDQYFVSLKQITKFSFCIPKFENSQLQDNASFDFSWLFQLVAAIRKIQEVQLKPKSIDVENEILEQKRFGTKHQICLMDEYNTAREDS